MAHETSAVNAKTHYFQTRDYELAERVDKLPNSAFVGAHEVAALSGIAVSSIQKPTQRKSIGLAEPRVIGRQIKWPLGTVRAWLQMDFQDKIAVTQKAAADTPQRQRGRPTKAQSVAASRNHHA